MKVLQQIFIAIGQPFYFLLKFLFSKFSNFKIQLPSASWRTSFQLRKRRVTIVYRAPRFTLKGLLKTVYPWIHPLFLIRIPKIHLPKLKLKLGLEMWGLGIAVILLLSYFYIFKDLPSPSTLTTQIPPLTTHIRDRRGIELYKIYRTQNRTLVKLVDIPLQLRQATIAIEDAEFYQHPGFSVRGIARAISRNIGSGRPVEGGSTITQQLVKSALLSPEQTLQRKLRELILAMAVEIKFSKDEILEMYLNRVGYGGAAYGVEEAAETYFGKSVNQLDLAEAALLAGLPASPTTYSPFGAHPELAKVRQQEVLTRMVSERFITWEQAESASNESLRFTPPATNILAPHFVLYVKELLAQKYGTYVVEQGGLDVITSLDLSIQKTTQQAVTQEINKISYLNITNGAALVTNPQTGEILAMVGSRDYFDTAHDGNVNVTLRSRQPGSSIKPVNYALAFSRGFTPASVIDDSPITYKSAGQPNYSPVNYDGKYHGRVTLRTALASSYNIPAVKLLAANGVGHMIEMGQKMGIMTWGDTGRFGLSLTLGGGEVTMADMATVFGVFANQGQKVDLRSILQVRDSRGRALEEFRCPKSPISIHAAEAATEIISCDSQPVLDPKIAFMISDILSDNSARTPAFGSNSDLNLPEVAVKTGTTNNLRDNWTIGFTPNRLVAVWVGNNNNSPMNYVASGVTGASPIWRRIMITLLKDNPTTGFSPPPDLIRVAICTITGELACPACPSRTEYFLPGTQPQKACTEGEIKNLLEEKAKKEQQEHDKILTGASTP